MAKRSYIWNAHVKLAPRPSGFGFERRLKSTQAHEQSLALAQARQKRPHGVNGVSSNTAQNLRRYPVARCVACVRVFFFWRGGRCPLESQASQQGRRPILAYGHRPGPLRGYGVPDCTEFHPYCLGARFALGRCWQPF